MFLAFMMLATPRQRQRTEEDSSSEVTHGPKPSAWRSWKAHLKCKHGIKVTNGCLLWCTLNASLSFPVLHQRQVNGGQQLPVRPCDFREGCVTASISPDVVWAGSSYPLALQVTYLSRTLRIAKLQTQQKTVCKSAQIQTFPPPWCRTGGVAMAMTDFWMSAHASEAGKADKEANKLQISCFAGWKGRCCYL